MCRRRCRMFPSLVSCCTIDWFVDWPQEALLSVAHDALKPLGDEELVNNLANICVIMHKVWNPMCWFLAAICKPLNKFLSMGPINLVKFKAFMADKCSKIFFDSAISQKTRTVSSIIMRSSNLTFSSVFLLYIVCMYCSNDSDLYSRAQFKFWQGHWLVSQVLHAFLSPSR